FKYDRIKTLLRKYIDKKENYED
ncbi:recombinase RecX, partial [Brachyspira hampsonii]|nr:recombinase RecX [Brachyspira hampsonii]